MLRLTNVEKDKPRSNVKEIKRFILLVRFVKAVYERATYFAKRIRCISDEQCRYISCILMMLLMIVIFIFYEGIKYHKFDNYNEEIKRNMLPIGNASDKDYYITRPNGRDDGGVVHVMFAMFSTNINEMLCYAVASAYFTNIPIVVVGYKIRKYSHIDRHYRWMEAANAAKLEEHDILMKLDSDIMFTGLDYFPFVDKFIKLSSANLNELDAKAIRTGEALPPILYGTEVGSFSPQSISKNESLVHEIYLQVEQMHDDYERTILDIVKPFFNYKDNIFEHLNGGTSIQRVWAMRELTIGATKFMQYNTPINKREKWSCDQSVFTKLYLELRLWEIEQDYFRKTLWELRTITNEYGLHAGLMGLDLRNDESVMVHRDLQDGFELTSELWESISEHSVQISAKLNDWHLLSQMEKLYNNVNATRVFTQRKLTRSYSNVHSVTIAPPLLSVVPRHINGKDKPEERVYPWLAHFAAHPKNNRYQVALSYMQWSLPMMFDKEEWKRGKQYAMSMPIELWTGNDEKLRLRYGDVCEKHPFNNDKLININKTNY